MATKREKAAEAARGSDLEDMIRAAAANGELTHLSVVPVAGKGPYGCSWSASFSPASSWANGFGRADDPVEALKIAMTDKTTGRVVNDLHKTLTDVPKDSPLKARAMKAAEGLGPTTVDDEDFV